MKTEITTFYVSVEDGREVYARTRFTDKQTAIDFAKRYAEIHEKVKGMSKSPRKPEYNSQILHLCLSYRSNLYCNVVQCTEEENGIWAHSTFGNF